MLETRVGIRELKAGLSGYLRQVKAGATLLITEHGKGVGHIVPLKPSLEERLRQLADTNVISWSGRKLRDKVARVRLQGRKTVADLLLEDRE